MHQWYSIPICWMKINFLYPSVFKWPCFLDSWQMSFLFGRFMLRMGRMYFKLAMTFWLVHLCVYVIPNLSILFQSVDIQFGVKFICGHCLHTLSFYLLCVILFSVCIFMMVTLLKSWLFERKCFLTGIGLL